MAWHVKPCKPAIDRSYMYLARGKRLNMLGNIFISLGISTLGHHSQASIPSDSSRRSAAQGVETCINIRGTIKLHNNETTSRNMALSMLPTLVAYTMYTSCAEEEIPPSRCLARNLSGTFAVGFHPLNSNSTPRGDRTCVDVGR